MKKILIIKKPKHKKYMKVKLETVSSYFLGFKRKKGTYNECFRLQ
jgi:hypothetical protein